MEKVIERLSRMLCLSTDECLQHMANSLALEGYEVFIGEGNSFVFAVPKTDKIIPVLLCCHADTARRTGKLGDEPVCLCIDNDKITNDNGILGADDRAGCQIILEVQNEFSTKPFILCTNFEESGFSGIRKFIASKLIDKYKDVLNLFISVDRRGYNECVYYYDGIDDDIEYDLETVGYTVSKGFSRTDALLLRDVTGVEHINVSYGGFNPHSASEFILCSAYKNCISLLSKYIQLPNRKYELYNDEEPLVPTEIEYVSLGCDICGSVDVETHYSVKHNGVFCAKCLKKLENSTVNLVKEALRQERKQSREANLTTNTAKPKEHNKFPSCPVCHDNTFVSWNKDTAGFTCTSCRYKHDFLNNTFSGNFWQIDGTKSYCIDNIAITVSENNERLMWTGPLNLHPFLNKCDMCGDVVTFVSEIPTVFNGVTLKVKVCTDCWKKIMQEVSDKDKAPWE